MIVLEIHETTRDGNRVVARACHERNVHPVQSGHSRRSALRLAMTEAELCKHVGTPRVQLAALCDGGRVVRAGGNRDDDVGGRV